MTKQEIAKQLLLEQICYTCYSYIYDDECDTCNMTGKEIDKNKDTCELWLPND